jgi:iron complex outermembrane recepter protein
MPERPVINGPASTEAANREGIVFKNSNRAAAKSALLLGVSAIAFAGAAYAQDQIKAFDVPEQLATTGIREFAREANIQILASADDIREKRTNAIVGNLSVHDALSHLLEGTDITIASDDGRTIVLLAEKRSATLKPAQSPRVMLAQALQVAQAQTSQSIQAQAQTARAASAQVPEQVLITGSLIHGTAAVGVPVTTLSTQDFVQTGSVTTADLFRNVPAAIVLLPSSQQGGGNSEKGQNVNLHNLDSPTAVRSLMMVDSIRMPPTNHGTKANDPSIIPSIALDRIDVLADGASATYGSDAISGVINIILKRGYNGIETQARAGVGVKGGETEQFDALFGRTWEGGDITVSGEWYNQAHIGGTGIRGLTVDYSPWGLDNRIPVVSSIPGLASVGGFPSVAQGTTCTNCFSIPTGQNGQNLTWAQIAANPGVKNLINPYALGWGTPSQERVAGTATFDQNITSGVQFFADGFYSNRRAQMLEAEIVADQGYNTYFVPASNPFLPAGAPTTCPKDQSQCGLFVSYSFANEIPPHQSSYELADHWDAGVNVTLPLEWNNRTYISSTQDKSQTWFLGQGQPAAAAAALGNIVVPGKGFSTFTKPANIPYLNLFCDPNAFARNTCNDQATLDYVTGFRQQAADSLIREFDTNFDGPLFDLPGGSVRVAVGADYSIYNTTYVDNNSFNQPTPAPAFTTDPESRNVWAVFGQVNIPVFSDANAIPGFRKLELEASWRHDNYSDVGGTSNPKVSFTWMPLESVTLRGSWGTSFRAPAFGEVSSVANAQIHPVNSAAGGLNGNELAIVCGANGQPKVGSAAYVLWQAGAACGSSPGGIYLTGGAGNSATVRGGVFIKPETANNYAGGAEFAPTTFLKGLDVAATYYSVRISGVLQSFKNNQAIFNDPGFGFLFYTPPATGAAKFQQLVNAIIARARSEVFPQFASGVQWIEDGGAQNAGWLKQDGIDFNASYDWDMEALGAWNVGIVGTYTLHNILFSGIVGSTPQDQFHTTSGTGPTEQFGVPLMSRLIYRARLGWASSDSTYSATLFMNYRSHFFTDEKAPPNSYLVNFPNYSNIQPNEITFDLSLGYNTGTNPANDYLKNIGVQLVVQNLLNKHSAFAYNLSGGSTAFGRGNPSAQSDFADLIGRMVSVTLIKNW